MSIRVSETKQWLKNKHHVSVPDDWLEACIEWIHGEVQSHPLSLEDVQKAVYEQWLISDLNILESASLPATLTQEQKCTLNGNHCLQIDSLLDVSSSLYSQYQKTCGAHNENVDVSATQHESQSNPWEAISCRMLMLQLTDGSVNIQGMEYQSIPALSTSTKPGTKILVTGPVMCRLGVLILTKQCVKVLGGQVDTLMEENRQIKLLARALNQDDDIAAAGCDSNELPAVQPAVSTHGGPVVTRNSADDVMEIVDDDLFNQIDEDELAMMNEQWDEGLNDDLLVQHMESQIQCGNDRFMNRNAQRQSRTKHDQSCLPGKSSSSTHSDDVTSVCEQRTALSVNSSRCAPRSKCVPSESSRDFNVACAPERTDSYLMEFSSMSEFDDDAFEDDFDVKSDDMGATENGKKSSLGVGMVIPEVGVSAMKAGNASSIQNPVETSVGSTLGDFRQFRNSCSVHDVLPVAKKPKIRSPAGVNEVDLPMAKMLRVDNSYGDDFSDMTFNDFDAEVVDLTCEPSSQTSQLNTTEKYTNISPCLQSPTVLSLDMIKNCILNKVPLLVDTPSVGLFMEPYTYLSVVLRNVPFVELTTVKVKAYISTLLTKLDHGNFSRWSLDVKINDGTAACDVTMGNEILTEMIGFTAAGCKILKQQGKHDQEARTTMSKGIQSCQKTLTQLACIMELEFKPSIVMPTVVARHPVTQQTLVLLKNRIRMSSCSGD